MNSEEIDTEFAEDVRRGLSAERKFLMSRYFYDAQGDRLFQAIMRAPEYYLTDCELDVLRSHGREIAEEIARSGPFELVELGCGDGRKVHHLLDALNDIGADFVFRPVDISPHVLELLEERL
ncbi:MAG: L-histidine N(alpha)-methyltransferase, partial [Gammaproteobacteria bacterium]